MVLDVVDEALGPFVWMIPCMNLGLAITLMVWSYKTFPLLGIAAAMLLIVDYSVSTSEFLFANPNTWDGTDFRLFGLFIVIFAFPIVNIHATLLDPQGKMRQFWVETVPPYKIIATQILRLAGSIFFLLDNAGLVPKLFGTHTGVLDVSMGITAPVVSYLVYSRGVEANQTLLCVWHTIGLYDFVWALGYIFFDYCGLIGGRGGQPALAIMGFHPISLLAFFQVAWAFTLHVFFLLYMNDLVEAERRRSRQTNDASIQKKDQ